MAEKKKETSTIKTEKDLLDFHIKRANRLEDENERLKEELRKYRGY